MISTLFISGSGFLWNQYSSRQEARKQNVENLDRLSSEISYRLSLLTSIEKPEFTYPEMYTATGVLIGIEGNKDVDGDIIGYFTPIHEAFERRGLASLLWEWSSELKKRGRANDIADLLPPVRALTADLDDKVIRIAAVLPGISSSRWRFVDEQIRQANVARLARIRTSIEVGTSVSR